MYTLYLFEVLVTLCLSTSPSCLLFSTPSCLRRLVSTGLLPGLHAHRLPWGWWKGWRQERERYVFPTSSCFVLWVCQRLLPSGLIAPPQRPPPRRQHSLDIPKLPGSWCLTIPDWFPKLAYICVNSSFIICSAVVSLEWNSSFCWELSLMQSKREQYYSNKNVWHVREKEIIF